MNHPETTAITVAAPRQFDLSPQTFDQALTFSQYLADSDMVPKDFKGKPGNCLVAIQWGMELGLKPLQAMQNIAVINGRPSLWGDAVIALARSSPACEYIIETQTATEATCKVKRRGEPEQERTFSMADAKTAGLIGKQGPWSQYPKRMMQMRARAFALRDVFPDVLKGLPVAEEVMDMPSEPRNMGAVHEVAADVNALIALGQLSRTDSEAAEFWKVNNGKLAGNPSGHARLKDAIVAHRKDMKEARTVDVAPPAPAPATAPEITLSEVLSQMDASLNEDALNDVMSLASALTGAGQAEAAEERYTELLAEIRGST